MKLLATLTAALVLAAPAHATTGSPLDRIHAGQPRWKVQRILDQRGHRVGMWATGKHRHLTKTYTVDGQAVRVDYVGPLCACGPYSGPYRVKAVGS